MNTQLYTPDTAIKEYASATGRLRFEHYVAAEDKVIVHNAKNMVVTAGLVFIASRIVGTSSAVMGWMEVGTDGTAAALGNTALGAVIASSRTALTSATAGTPTASAVRFICTFAPGVGTGAWTEAGIFNQVTSGGSMLARTTFLAVNKAAGDSITVTWDLTLS